MPCQWYQLWLGVTYISGTYKDINDQTPTFYSWKSGYPGGSTTTNIYLGMDNGSPNNAMWNSYDSQVGYTCQYRPGMYI